MASGRLTLCRSSSIVSKLSGAERKPDCRAIDAAPGDAVAADSPRAHAMAAESEDSRPRSLIVGSRGTKRRGPWLATFFCLYTNLALRERASVQDCRMRQFLEQSWMDARIGARSLLRDRVFTIVAALTLSVGVALNAAMFSVVNAVLLRPPVYANPEQPTQSVGVSFTQGTQICFDGP